MSNSEFILLEQKEWVIKHPLLYSQTLQGTFMVITCLILKQPQEGGTIISSMIRIRDMRYIESRP